MSLSSLLFPNAKPIQEVIAQYSTRPSGQLVTRIAPSPTGFLHLWHLFTGLINSKLTQQSNWVLIFRVEDTDQARNTTNYEEKKWWIYALIEWFKAFWIEYNEWVILWEDKEIISIWSHWPYIQSERLDIYKSFISYLLDTNQAYVCFMTPQELENLRTSQQLSKQATGVYGNFAIYRDASEEEVKAKLLEWRDFVIRRKSHKKPWDKVVFHDGIRWTFQMDDNYLDQVLFKSYGFPSFALAHVTDDYLMGTTQVIRSDERLPSVPHHIELYLAFKEVFTREQWLYNHISPIQKMDNGSRRKLSKRKDPEADIQVLINTWYPTEGVLTYLMCLLNSNFEDRWRENNSLKYTSYKDFKVSLDKCNISGAIFDIKKLDYISAEYLSIIPINRLFDELVNYYSNHNSTSITFKGNEEYLKRILWSDRNKKLHTTYQDILNYIEPLLQDTITIDGSLFPSNITKEKREQLVTSYSELLDKYFNTNEEITIWKEERRELTKTFAANKWFAVNKKEYIEWTHLWLISDFAMILRVLLYGKQQTPDIYTMITIYGKEKTSARLLTKQ